MKDLCLETFNSFISPMIYWENHKQIKKWGIQKHSAATWMLILSEEHGELAQAILQYHYEGKDIDKIIKEAIQAATVAIKIAEMFLADRCMAADIVDSETLAKQILGE